MKFFKNLFKKKEEPIKEEIIEEIPTKIVPEQICHYCQSGIESDDKVRKFANKLYHRKCFKRMRKDAVKVAFG